MSTSDIKMKKLSAITVKLLRDHEQIRSLLKQLQESLQDICHRQSPSGLQKAQETIRTLIQVMNLHAAREERVVFPALSNHHPILALEAEHDELTLQRVALMAGILNYSFPEDCTDTLYNQYIEFIELLQRHLAKEESLIFPLIEQSLSSNEKQHVLEKMEQIV